MGDNTDYLAFIKMAYAIGNGMQQSNPATNWKCEYCGTVNPESATYCGEMHIHAAGCNHPRVIESKFKTDIDPKIIKAWFAPMRGG